MKYHVETGTFTIAVKVVPGAFKTTVVGSEGEWLKIRVAAPPADGKANQALVEFLARLLSVPKSYIEIKSGFTSRHKVVQIRSCDSKKVRELLTREPVRPTSG
ncbi:MAG TPA: DUF167 domain-containing protein [Terriglobia bacterium]|nr:DUF167 domain-containing protein [Terriglobia bacterium]